MSDMIRIDPNGEWSKLVGDQLQEKLDRYVGELGVELRWRVARRTPVLTGRARGNWNLSFNEPNYNYDWEYYDKSGELGDNEARAQAENAKAGDVIYICNGLPYIGALNNGWSKKAPPGFIELTAAEAPFIAEQVANGMGESLHGGGELLGLEEGP